ncbi:UNVERIFIED_CONTAM: hypothetical protein Slati_4176600 [Sesamum latifolium]|uniref:Uncharacterized protein n=1 Tax=Sesamum latifolium TaxID=2727402 RepID=A0AAW2TB24_9LAMI
MPPILASSSWGPTSSGPIVATPSSARIPSPSRGSSHGLNDPDDISSCLTPFLCSQYLLLLLCPLSKPFRKMWGGENSPIVGVSTKCKRKLIGANDSNEADDGGDDLPLSSLATKRISISGAKTIVPAKKFSRTSKGDAGKGKARISPHLEPQIIVELEESFVSIPT